MCLITKDSINCCAIVSLVYLFEMTDNQIIIKSQLWRLRFILHNVQRYNEEVVVLYFGIHWGGVC